MPYSKVRNHESCPAERPVGVVADDDPEKVLGCHENDAKANAQIAALYAQDEEASADLALEDEAGGVAWAAPNGIVHEGVATGDGRMFAPGALEWPDPATTLIPLRWQPADLDGHTGAVLVGRVDYLARDGERIVASGIFDTNPNAQEAARLVRAGFLRGVSVDVDDADGDIVENADGTMTQSFTKGRIRAATLVDIPAFAGAEIEVSLPVLVGDRGPELAYLPEGSRLISTTGANQTTGGSVSAATGGYGFDIKTITAPSAFTILTAPLPKGPPSEYFTDPHLSSRRGLHVEAPDSEGWQAIWGHLYGWGECHLGSPPGMCVSVPKGSTLRSMFASQDGRGVVCADGQLVPTGPVVLSADHAPTKGTAARWLAARSHYDHTGLAVGDVTVGEDDHGIWFAGVIRPGTAPEMVHALQASGVSGDWRPIGGALELIACLGVNTPGYPALVASIEGGEVVALIASASAGEECGCHSTAPSLAALQATLAQHGRTIAELERITASARGIAIAEMERTLGVPSRAELAARIEEALLV